MTLIRQSQKIKVVLAIPVFLSNFLLFYENCFAQQIIKPESIVDVNALGCSLS
jgi:hypothetical protein